MTYLNRFFSSGTSAIHVLAILGLFTATGDVFFVFQLGGLTVRYTQIFLLAAVALFLTQHGGAGFKKPLGVAYLLVVFGLNLAFLPNSPFFNRNVAYAIALFFNILTIIFYTNYYGVSEIRLRSLLRWYIRSFLFVGAFGLLQFLSGLAGKSLLTQQWLVEGRLPRLNGFSYEPSYFALYIMSGWITLVLLLDHGSKIVSRRTLITGVCLLSAVEILSTSRSGLAMMYAVFIAFCLAWIYRAYQGERIGRVRKSIGIAGFLGPAVLVAYISIYQFWLIQALTAGIGILRGGTTHSIGERTDAFARTVALAMDHPVIGVGLGGVGPSISDRLFPGITYDQYMVLHLEGLNVFAEVFAAVGITGGLALIAYLAKQFQVLLWRRSSDNELFIVASALAFGMLGELVLLLFEQNIMRTYLWVHIAVLAAVNYALFERRSRSTGPKGNTSRVSL